MGSFWLGILGGIVAWFATMLIGQPFYEPIGLRRETARLLHLYEPRGPDGRWAIRLTEEERTKAYQDCAAKLLAFFPLSHLRADAPACRLYDGNPGRQVNCYGSSLHSALG